MYDFAIIGGGPTGYAAAMYAGRLNLSTVIINGTPGGLIITTDIVENYPGFKSIGGYDIFQNIREHAKIYNVAEVSGMAVLAQKHDSGFIVGTEKEKHEAKTVLFATGATHRKMPVQKASEFENKGIHYCALCDGFAYKDKLVAVVGGADSAAKESLQLSSHAKQIYILCRGKTLRGEPVNVSRVLQNPKIKLITEVNVVNILGKERVEGVETDRPIDGSTNLSVDGIFVAIGHKPQSDLARSLGVALNEKGEIIINRFTETNVPGVYAAGDVADTPFKQMIIGCAEGVMAAYRAYEHLTHAV
ncbi:MAG: FAD-dependent oxidoreductase [Candidatus Jacksonbacteria bacterium]|nr:FAD-dependent oxidoreductase [Candidatus Jacksonbacteria bacterium]